MPQKNLLRLKCSVCGRINYFTTKNKKVEKEKDKKLELKKFCRFCRKHAAHKETRK